MSGTLQKQRVVLSTVSSDSHTWNLVFLQLLLEEQGYEVVNLGACVPDGVLIEAVRLHRPDSVVISSVNGHGHIDGARLIAALRADADPRVAGVPVMIGGKLGIRGADDADLAGELVAAGFDAVFSEGADPGELGRTLARFTPAGALGPAAPAAARTASARTAPATARSATARTASASARTAATRTAPADPFTAEEVAA
ncbi:cobalamin B12-binding domain-containing protein [Kitasatospora sp. NA04385]|uniref:cobalamin B12-binding domain-containing protein n=1 Tax=Kitasatospora sp. NA04385 TaxID=2742135 RepID=UPI001592591D|nr:cobalamin B12-binding domain-containing protein [Kitasatospora sp. NA04385]